MFTNWALVYFTQIASNSQPHIEKTFCNLVELLKGFIINMGYLNEKLQTRMYIRNIFVICN